MLENKSSVENTPRQKKSMPLRSGFFLTVFCNLAEMFSNRIAIRSKFPDTGKKRKRGNEKPMCSMHKRNFELYKTGKSCPHKLSTEKKGEAWIK